MLLGVERQISQQGLALSAGRDGVGPILAEGPQLSQQIQTKGRHIRRISAFDLFGPADPRSGTARYCDISQLVSQAPALLAVIPSLYIIFALFDGVLMRNYRRLAGPLDRDLTQPRDYCR